MRYPGQHQAILTRPTWNRVQKLLRLHTVLTVGKRNGSMSSPLAGRVFDETGERLTPSHAAKGSRRYRYYVSRSLMRGAAGQDAKGWRIPAPEIERKLAAALAGILDDRAGIVRDLECDLDAAEIQSILETAGTGGARLRSEDESANALSSLIDRAEVATDGIRLSIRVPSEERAQSPNAPSSFLRFKRYLPLQVRRRGLEMRLVVGGGSATKVDSAILKAVVRANQWLTELLSGSSSSLVEIGRRAGVGKRYVSRIIRLAFLSPSIIEEIARGQQPAELTAQVLTTGRAVASPLANKLSPYSARPFMPHISARTTSIRGFTRASANMAFSTVRRISAIPSSLFPMAAMNQPRTGAAKKETSTSCSPMIDSISSVTYGCPRMSRSITW
jgi:hypothetical protein